MAEVIVVGAGPTGLMLVGELALADVDVQIVERRSSSELVGMRARGFHSRTIEILDQRGIAARFLDAGQTFAATSFANAPVDLSDLPTRHPYTLALVQSEVERILTGWVEELGVPIHRGREVVGFDQDADGVDVHLADGAPMRCSYLVSAEGGRSTIRKAAGIDFPGWEATRTTLIAEVEVTEETPKGVRIDETGIHGINPIPGGSTMQVLVTEQQLGPATEEPTLADLSGALVAVFGTDFGVHSPRTISRFSDATRQAAAYRAGRVLVAGDAAHVHSPTGGQGIGLGVEDAVNLGWKLAEVVKGVAPDNLLDTYQEERHPPTARVLKYTMAMAVTQLADGRVGALADLVADLVSIDAARVRLGCLHLGLDVRYDAEEGSHALVGRRMPDLDLTTADGPVRVFTLLHDARPVLLDLESAHLSCGTRAGRVRLVEASYDGAWDLPVVGAVDAPAAVLVRPDGHVAWVGHGTDAGLEEALTRWFGS